MGEYEEYQSAEKQAMERTLELLAKGLSRESKEELDYAFISTLASQYQAGLARVEPIAFNRILRKLNRILRNKKQWGDD